MEHSSIIALINEVEERFPVNDWKVNGIHLWPMIRIEIAFRLYDLLRAPVAPKAVAESPAVARPGIREVINRVVNWENRSIKHKLDDLRFERRVNAKAEALFLVFSAYRTELNGKAYNKMADPILDVLGKRSVRSLVLELSNGIELRLPRYNKDKCIVVEKDIQRYLWKQQGNSAAIKICLDGFDECIQWVAARAAGVDISQLGMKRIGKLGRDLVLLKEFFKKILLKNNSKASFVTCYYALPCMALCAASRDLGIPSVDIQHGSQGAMHAAYGRWNAVPPGGYELLPSVFWNWSEGDKNEIMKWASATNGAHRSVIGGNNWNDMWLDPASRLTGAYSEKVKTIRKPNGFHLLYSMQPISDAVPDFIINAIRDSPSHWKWWIRLHPRQMHDEAGISELLKKNCGADKFDIASATRLPLPALLSCTDIHITQWSSVVIEAENFQVPSILIHRNGIDMFRKQVDSGAAFFFASSSSAELIETITEAKGKISKGSHARKELLTGAIDEILGSEINKQVSND